MSPESRMQMQALEEANPDFVEELMMKRRWRNMQKDPARSLKDQSLDTSSYWQQLNQLPKKGVEKIVNDRIIEKDRQTCDNILTSIFEDKKKQELKVHLQQLERQKLRQAMHDRH